VGATLRTRLGGVRLTQRLCALAELLRAEEQAIERFPQTVATATPDQLARPTANPSMKETLPTVKNGLAFLLTGQA
jgi:hypothetical protein